MRASLKVSEVRRKRFAAFWVKRLLFLCLGLSPAAASFAASAKVDDVRGTVDMRAPGALQWRVVSPGERVEEGSIFRTGSHSTVDIVTAEGHHFVVKADSSLQFKSLQDGDTKAYLDKGRLISKVKTLKGLEKFSVQTPTAVCAVRGTEFDTVTGDGGTLVSVYHGVVGVAIPGTQDEIRVPAGQMTSVRNGSIERPRPIPQDTRKKTDNALAHEARHEVGLDMDRNAVIAAAAMERRYADYTEGKSLVDVEGRRVRLDEYIVRTTPDSFKFVVLNERNDQLDYYFYKGTFNQPLPVDLSVALKDLSGKLGETAPDYFLTSYEMGQSNTRDSIHDTATGGHLVKIEVDGSGNYVLTDAADPTNTRTVAASELQLDGTYKVYHPLADSFSTVTEAQLPSATQIGVFVPESDSFKNLSSGDTFWKGRFNSYTHAINDVTKINYTKSGAANTLANPLDATWNYAGGFVLPVVSVDANNIDATVTHYYGDGTFESYRTVLIDDSGAIAPLSAFSGASTGAQYKEELLKWNYEQQITATEFEGRKIDLVVEPKIFIKSGLIQ